jgi:hypothetical protein
MHFHIFFDANDNTINNVVDVDRIVCAKFRKFINRSNTIHYDTMNNDSWAMCCSNPNSPYTTNGKFGLRAIQNHLRKKLQWMLMVIL